MYFPLGAIASKAALYSADVTVLAAVTDCRSQSRRDARVTCSNRHPGMWRLRGDCSLSRMKLSVEPSCRSVMRKTVSADLPTSHDERTLYNISFSAISRSELHVSVSNLLVG